MTSTTARIRPAYRSARSVLADVGAALRQIEPASLSALGAPPVMPGLSVLQVTESPDELIVVFTSDLGADSSTVRQAVAKHIHLAAGSRSAAAKLVVTWAETGSQLAVRAD